MTWSRMIGYLLAAAGVRWLAQHVSPNADAYLAAGVVGLWLVATFHRRTRGYAIADVLNRTSGAERDALLAKLAPKPLPETEALTLTLDEAVDDTLAFAYPAGSRSFATFQFWMCVLLGAGFLAPLALGRVTELGDGWILFLIGAALLLSGFGHRRRIRWLGTRLILSPESLTELRSGGRSLALPWGSIVAVVGRRPGLLVFESAECGAITVWPELEAYVQFEALAGEHLRRRGRPHS
ncbi:MAG TPA: hypothetical protein VMY76_04875 [Gemmatimonadales bacterium]|nr:hypothetical protein [Gemmatimonadales bacterium]